MFQQTSEGISFAVKVTPKSRANKLIGWRDDLLGVRIAAVPEKGAANEELEHFIASLLNVGRTQVQVVHGHGSRYKRLLVSGVSLDKLMTALQDA